MVELDLLLLLIVVINSMVMSYVTKSSFKFVDYPTYSNVSITQPGQTVNLDEVVKRLQRGEKVSMYDSYVDKDVNFDTLVLHRNDLKNMTNEQVERLSQTTRANEEIGSSHMDAPTDENSSSNE